MKNILLLTRPKHWVKNVFVLLPVFFAGSITDLTLLSEAVMAFLAYSFAASAIYCYNDIIDVEDDRRHSVKCLRPIASGKVSISMGYAIMLCAMALSAIMVVLSGRNSGALGIVVSVYFILDLAYCRILKEYAIVDVVVLSIGFVLRIMAGSAATAIVPSQWLVLMTFLLTLLMGFAKRRDDVLRMQRTGEAPRHNTHRYNITFINQAVTVTASITLVCYIMYTMSPEVTQRIHFPYLYLTTIFVILGILRYMQITAVDEKSGDPTQILLSDRFLQTIIILWVLSFLLILYVFY